MRYYSSTQPGMPQLRNGDPWGTLADLLKYVNDINKKYLINSMEKQADNNYIRINVDEIDLVKGQTILLPNSPIQATIINKTFEYIDVLLVNRADDAMPDEFHIEEPDMYITYIGLGMQTQQMGDNVVLFKANNFNYGFIINDADPSNDIYTYQQDGNHLANPSVAIMSTSEESLFVYPQIDEAMVTSIGMDGAIESEDNPNILHNGVTKWTYQRSNRQYIGDGTEFKFSVIKWHIYGDGNSIYIFFDNPNIINKNYRTYGYFFLATYSQDGGSIAILNSSFQRKDESFYENYNNSMAHLVSNAFAHKQPYDDVESFDQYIYSPLETNHTVGIYNEQIISLYMAPLLYAKGYSGQFGGDYVSRPKIFSPFAFYNNDTDELIAIAQNMYFSHNSNVTQHHKSFTFIPMYDYNGNDHYYSYIKFPHIEFTHVNAYLTNSFNPYIKIENVSIFVDLLSQQMTSPEYNEPSIEMPQ